MAERLYLIDGSAFAYRSYYAIRGLTNSEGRPTNAVFGFVRVLLKLLREEQPSHIAVVFDAPGKTFREDLYPEYKATREPTPEDLISQMPLIDETVKAFGIPLIRVEGVEADDVMGTLARRAEEAGMETVLVSGDKDLLQLVTDRIKVYDPAKGDRGAWYGIEEVQDRFGAPPEHVVDALALMGDTADNVPGVRGIGEKTAKNLLELFGTLEGVYEHLNELKGKQRERLETDKEMAFLSRELVTIRTDLDLEVNPENLRRRDVDTQRLAEVFDRLEFRSLLEEFLPAASAKETLDYRVVLAESDLGAAIEEMRTAGEFALDTETTSTDPMRADLVGISMSRREASAYYIPVGHAGEELAEGPSPADQLPKTLVLDRVRPLLEDPTIGKTGHNIKYDLVVLERAGIRVAGVCFDTMVGSYLTDPSRLRHNLDEISLHYLKRKKIPISDLIGKGSKSITFDKVPISRACGYACEDADVTWRLTQVLRPALREAGLERLFREVELPLVGVLARMEQAGVTIDQSQFEQLQREVEGDLAALEQEIFEIAGESFQINSPKQLQQILFEKLGLKRARRTKTGYSTDMEVLEELAREHPLPEKVLAYRTLEKLRGTYIEALPKLVNPATGRIHTSFNQAVAATGRLSSSDPNLQNIPVRTEIGRRIRQGFIPSGVGWKLISADYSQIELRILAHLSGDAALREAFSRGQDVHQDTAARIFRVLPEQVTPEMRRRAKAVNFGVVYGISPFGLAKNVGCSTREAAEFIDTYFRQYPGVRHWIDGTLEEAREKGYVSTLLNRRRYIPDLKSSNGALRRAAERMAINTPVQGSAADVIKLAMVRLDAALRGTEARLLLQVHDELVAEAPASQAETVAHTMKEIMENAITLDVSLKVDVGVGDNWTEVHA